MKNDIGVIDETTKHHFNSGVYAREMRVPKGFAVETHSHKFSHMSILAEGSVILITNGEYEKYDAPAVISMGAGIHHGIEAIEDSVWFCIHPVEAETPEEVEEITIEPASFEYFKEGGDWEKIGCLCRYKNKEEE